MNQDHQEETIELIQGTGNVYRDFNHPNPKLAEARALVGIEIMRTLDSKKLSTREAERLTGISHADFSRIRNAKFHRFTLDRLITILNKLDETLEVTLNVRPSSPSRTRTRPVKIGPDPRVG